MASGILMLGLIVITMNTAIGQPNKKADKIDGEWHVLGTTFPMWKKGTKINPRFRYTPLEEGVWKDEVLYETKKGKTKTIKGKDRLEGENPTRFRWRGDGLLAIAVSKWQIDYLSADGGLMLISFEKTAFTPAGADVISRKKSITETEKKQMIELFQKRFEGKMDGDWVWLR
jgi:hypothetical protein